MNHSLHQRSSIIIFERERLGRNNQMFVGVVVCFPVVLNSQFYVFKFVSIMVFSERVFPGWILDARWRGVGER